jgi:hypothetical protein
MNNDIIDVVRVSIKTTGPDWQKFRELCEVHGVTISAAMTKVFYDTMKTLEENPSIWDKIKHQ